MLGFNWIDLLIVLLLIGSVLVSVRIGLVNQMFVVASFFAVLFAAGWVVPQLLPITDRTLKTIVNANLVLLLALAAAVKGYDLSQRLHWDFKHKAGFHKMPKMLDAAFGSLPGLIGALVAIWLLSVMLMRMPFAGLSNSVADSKIVRTLSGELPPVPAVFAEFDRQVDPNAAPSVLAPPPRSADFNYSVSDVQQAATQAQDSVVRITGFGCGGIASGSGFVVAPGLVATDAHVIAGVKRPIVKYQGRSYMGVPVLFDAARDIAFLRLNGFQAPGLTLETPATPVGNSVAIVGYPGGNYTVQPGIIRSDLVVFVHNIYDVGLYRREVYEIQAATDFGDSGGPVVFADGRVAGMLFSKSVDVPNDSYALSAAELQAVLGQALKSYRGVGTGVCLAQ